ncbi:hydroxymethylglutaryl-lyase [Niveomyces insectorum RCEF 264]|uniref:Putative lipoate-protein ligase A n=1 Tax=Niveomyces insectorum RCEF 264 TaxID=1081102 RepID=A0A167QHB3_9HYPO|nr:hydroxymethylglutaryl-lyase [Niveomyces insectorum RCEF 264]
MAAPLAWRPVQRIRLQRNPRALLRRCLATRTVSLAELFETVAGRPGDYGDDDNGERVHIVQSTGCNPFANLAVEQRLLERAHPASRLLLLYRNAPCVVIGRNQNPWAEVSLNGLIGDGTRQQQRTPVHLVRRRSGGGAVYHDAGNANWSVIGPSAGFDRDRYAHMVARALQRLGVTSARVNERHDIVIGGSCTGQKRDDDDDDDDDDVYKVSGSAYKLTRRRALHHGTCLLGADLAAVAGLLRAPPAAPYVLARGVASVRAAVQNVAVVPAGADTAHDDGRNDGRDPQALFAAAVTDEFERMYGPAASHSVVDVDAAAHASDGFAFDPPLAKGYAELKTPDWLFGQTPQFTFSTQPTADDPRPRPARPPDVPPAFQLTFTARHGRLQDVLVSGLPYDKAGAGSGSMDSNSAAAAGNNDAGQDRAVAAVLEGQLLYHIRDWQTALAAASLAPLDPPGAAAIGAWLDELFGVRCF